MTMTLSQSALEFCPVLDEIVRNGEAIGKSGKRIETSAISTTNNLLTLRHLHLASGATRTMEIGLRFGGSSLVFTQTHKDLGAAAIQQHIAVDPYQRSPFNDSSGLLAIERAGLLPYLNFHEDYSCRVLPQLLHAGRSFQIIYVDGSHCFEDVFIDMYYSTQLLEAGGVVLFDDSQHPHVKTMLRFVRRNLAHCLQHFDLLQFHPNHSIKFQIACRLGRTQLTAFKKTADLERPHGYVLSNF
jgi:predicted O-methyltransferase YrrM